MNIIQKATEKQHNRLSVNSHGKKDDHGYIDDLTITTMDT
jgi:hypothetical protein